jgi:hypothetical protein
MRLPRQRLRWWGKWVGTVVTLSLAVAWFASGWYLVTIDLVGKSSSTSYSLGAGDIQAIRLPGPGWGDHTQMSLERIGDSTEGPPIWGWPSHARISRAPEGGLIWWIQIPLLYVAAPLGVFTAWLWYGNRRHHAGSCPRCGYDLSATASGVCSECGAAVERVA